MLGSYRNPVLLTFVFLIGLFSTMSISGQNTIAGTIYDKTRTPLADIDVELLDEYYRVIPRGRQKTTSTGRYEFGGLNNGRYYIRVFAFHYDLADEVREVYLTSLSAIPGQMGTSFNLEDFYLQPRKGGLKDTELSVVFAQNVPKEAELAYKQALDDISKKREDEGFALLQKALEIYPTYFLALQRIGQELFLRKQYLQAAQAWLKAGDVNPKSAQSFYHAGYALFLLGSDYYKSALTCLSEAAQLAPNSAPVHLVAGTIYRKLGQRENAEKSLLQAKKVAPTKSPEIHRELAQLYDEMKKYRQAADELESYMKASQMSDEDQAKTKKVIAGLRAKSQSE